MMAGMMLAAVVFTAGLLSVGIPEANDLIEVNAVELGEGGGEACARTFVWAF